MVVENKGYRDLVNKIREMSSATSSDGDLNTSESRSVIHCGKRKQSGHVSLYLILNILKLAIVLLKYCLFILGILASRMGIEGLIVQEQETPRSKPGLEEMTLVQHSNY
jgi:hypothetical protein